MLGFRRRWKGGRGGCWGCIERPSYIHLSPPTHSPSSLSRGVPLARPLHPLSLFSLRHSWPSTPSASFSTSSTFSSYGFSAPSPSPPPAQALSHPSRLTYLNPPLFPQSLFATVLFSTPTPFRPLSRRLRLAPSHFRSLFL